MKSQSKALAVLSFALMLLLCWPEAARADLATTVETQPSAPIKITECHSAASKDGNVTIAFSINFENHDPRTPTAVRFNFALDDAFGTLLAIQPGDKLGMFSTGIPIGNTNSMT
jgi:hypothetical protein